MAITIPHEIIEYILDNLHSEKAILSNCALVQKSWAISAQRGLFQHITLKFPNTYHEDFDELATAYNERNEQLIQTFDRKPFLMVCVRTLELKQFGQIVPGNFVHRKEMLYTSTTQLIKRLHNLKSLLFFQGRWDLLSLELQEALMHLFNQPSLTRVTLSFFSILSLQNLASLLSQATNLQVLKLHFPHCYDWGCPTTPPIDHPSRSIRLDQSLCVRSRNIRAFVTWFQHDSCPFEIRELRSLELDVIKPPNDAEFASMLRYTGGHLQDLILHGPFDDQPSGLLHIGLFHDLRNLVMLNALQRAALTPVPWILSFFRPSQETKRETSSLRQLTISLFIDDVDIHGTHQWDAAWTAVDVLFTEHQFMSLETVKIELLGQLLLVLREIKDILIGKMPILNGTGKLEVEIPNEGESNMKKIKAIILS
ncbi:hypothetical protein C8R42DRAFT_171518 [Lentinula raphanica]|nr:hypothetical protein C8R42DRAFT_171518 [Lentinula raphanica]